MDLRHTALGSERLTLTAFASDDAAEIFDAVTPAVTRFMAFDPSPSRDAFAATWRDWLPKMTAGTELFLVVRLKPAGEFLGMAGLHGIGLAEPEPGIWIKPEAHGCGYGREAIATLISWAAGHCGAQGFIYPVVEANRPSRRLAVIVGTRTLSSEIARSRVFGGRVQDSRTSRALSCRQRATSASDHRVALSANFSNRSPAQTQARLSWCSSAKRR